MSWLSCPTVQMQPKHKQQHFHTSVKRKGPFDSLPLSCCMVLVLEDIFFCRVPWKKKRTVHIVVFHMFVSMTVSDTHWILCAPFPGYMCSGFPPVVSCRSFPCAPCAPSVSGSHPGKRCFLSPQLLFPLLHVSPGSPSRTI